MRKNKIIIRFLSIISLIALSFFYVPVVTAAGSLTALSDTVSRQQISPITSDHIIKFTTPTGLLVGGYKIQVDFPADYTATGVTYADMTVTYGASTGAESSLTLAAVPNAATWGAAFTGRQLNITSGTGTIPANSKVIINLTGTNKLVNPTTPGTYVIAAGIYNGATPVDTGKLATVILTSDQVVVSAVVDPSLTFSLDATATTFGSMLTGSIFISGTPSSINLTIGTNANSGYSVRVKDQGSGAAGGLYNSALSYLITSASSTLTTSTEGYGIQATSATATVASPYTATGNAVGALSTTPQSLATYASATSSNHTINIVHKASVSSSTKPGNYQDTITYLVTSNF